MNNILTSYSSHFCTECKCLCSMYQQGLSCNCDNPWITEVIHESDYPTKWIKCNVSITKEST